MGYLYGIAKNWTQYWLQYKDFFVTFKTIKVVCTKFFNKSTVDKHSFPNFYFKRSSSWNFLKSQESLESEHENIFCIYRF